MNQQQNEIEPVEGAPKLPVRMDDIKAAVEAHIAAIKPTSEPDGAAFETYLATAALKSMTTELHSKSSEKFVEVLEANGSTDMTLYKSGKRKGQPKNKFYPAEVIAGDFRYTAKFHDEKKLRDGVTMKDLFRAIFKHVEGDFDEFLNVLASFISSSGLKQGAIRAVLGESAWRKLFEVVPKKSAKKDEPRKRHVECINTYFFNKAIARRESLQSESNHASE